METIRIDSRFSGPTGLGNGGYVGGLLARAIAGSAEVTLRKPLPLDRPLTVEHATDGQILLKDNADILAAARPAPLDLELPQPPDLATAVAASANYIGFHGHLFPGCFVCGLDREENDGLRIFAGPLPGSSMVAAPWVPGSSFADPRAGGENGFVAPQYIWAALDCPGYFAIASAQPTMALLGRITAEILQPIQPGSPTIILGWPISREGRKQYAGTALFTPTGAPLARAHAAWIELPNH